MAVKTKRKKVIIFDDDEDILSICSYILDEKGWEVYTFSDTCDVLSRVGSICPDVIIMDNWIPDQGGIAATRELKQDPDLMLIPVIYFSANLEIASLAAHAGADIYIAKPFDLDELDGAINKVINC